MVLFGSSLIDFSFMWVFILLFIRLGGLFMALPGVGTEQVPEEFRLCLVVILAAALTATGIKAPEAKNVTELVVMLGSEFAYGYLLGAIPSYVLAGIDVAGQLISGSISLGQANMIDRSLGTSVSVLSKLQTSVATIVFLVLDGHHVVLRAAMGGPGELALGLFRPDMAVANLLVGRLVACFELAIVVSAPVIVATLITNFVLGLVTKFVPTVNIFIISLPLSVFLGLFIIAFSFPGLAEHVGIEFSHTEELLAELATRTAK